MTIVLHVYCLNSLQWVTILVLGYCMLRLPVNSTHGRLVTRSCRHTVNLSPVNLSRTHTRLVTQSTRHITKPPQCRAVRFGYLGLMSLYHSKDNWWQQLFVGMESRKKRDVAHTWTTWQVIAACAILKSPTTAKLLSATNAMSKSTVNSSQRLQTWR